jgi:hypothetical protein
MKLKTTDEGILIPKILLDGIQEVEVRKENDCLVLTPIHTPDPIWGLGSNPIHLGIPDAATEHNVYLYSIKE